MAILNFILPQNDIAYFAVVFPSFVVPSIHGIGCVVCSRVGARDGGAGGG